MAQEVSSQIYQRYEELKIINSFGFRLLIFNGFKNDRNSAEIPTTHQFINIFIGNKYSTDENGCIF